MTTLSGNYRRGHLTMLRIPSEIIRSGRGGYRQGNKGLDLKDKEQSLYGVKSHDYPRSRLRRCCLALEA